MKSVISLMCIVTNSSVIAITVLSTLEFYLSSGLELKEAIIASFLKYKKITIFFSFEATTIIHCICIHMWLVVFPTLTHTITSMQFPKIRQLKWDVFYWEWNIDNRNFSAVWKINYKWSCVFLSPCWPCSYTPVIAKKNHFNAILSFSHVVKITSYLENRKSWLNFDCYFPSWWFIHYYQIDRITSTLGWGRQKCGLRTVCWELGKNFRSKTIHLHCMQSYWATSVNS